MLKFLLPLVLVSSIAFPAELPKGEGVGFSSPYTVQGPAEQVITKNMNIGKCVLGTSLIDDLHHAGFQGLVQFTDSTNPKIIRSTMYDETSNQMAVISIVYKVAVPEAKQEDLLKVCVEYVGNTPRGRGDTFKSFWFNQKMDWNQTQLDGAQQEEKVRREKIGEPYQGDQNHA